MYEMHPLSRDHLLHHEESSQIKKSRYLGGLPCLNKEEYTVLGPSHNYYEQ